MSTEENGMTKDQGTDGLSETEGTEDVQQADTPEEASTTLSGVDETSRGDEDGNRGDDDPGSEQEDTFPREYVEELRKENARYRERAKSADDLAGRLHVALVAQTGKLADPTDLAFDEAHLEDPEALTAAVDELLERKPHLRARRVAGDVGQGQRGKSGGGPDLLEAMRGTL